LKAIYGIVDDNKCLKFMSSSTYTGKKSRNIKQKIILKIEKLFLGGFDTTFPKQLPQQHAHPLSMPEL